MKMTPSRGYLCRALYEWILDNQATPYLYVNAMAKGVEVPQEFVQNGQIVLNISPAATSNLMIHNDGVSFDARFNGSPRTIWVPVWAILGLVAQETNEGAFFDPEEIEPYEIDGSSDDKPDPEPPKPTKRPSLKVVK